MFKLQLNCTKVEQLDLGGAAESSGGKRFIVLPWFESDIFTR